MYIFRKIFTLCLLATICGGLQAQDAQKTERTIALWGHVKNSITRVGIKDAFITLMREDVFWIKNKEFCKGFLM